MGRGIAVAASVLGIVFALVDCGSGDGSAEEHTGLPPRTPQTMSGEAGGGPDPTLTDDASAPPPDEGDATTSVVGDHACDLAKPFGTPTILFDAALKSATPRLSADELTIYFTSDGGANGSDLFRAVRSSRKVKFGTPVAMVAQSSTANDNDPSVSSDHLMLFFHSARSGEAQIYWAKRASTAVDFGAPSLVPDVNDANAADAHAYYRETGGGELWLTSLRGGSTTYRMFTAKKTSTGFATPAVVSELSGAWDDWQPMITEDGLTLLFASNRPNGQGGYDLWLAQRAAAGDPWGTPAPITELNSPSSEFAGWISADRCRIYFSSSVAVGGTNLQRAYYAERPL